MNANPKGILLVIGAFLVIVASLFINRPPGVSPAAPSTALVETRFAAAQTAARLDAQRAASAARLVAQRDAVARDAILRASVRPQLQRALRAGTIYKIAPDGLWVAPAFYDLSFDAKQSLCAAVYAHSFGARPGEAFFLYDARTGKQIGLFGRSGLHLD